MPRGQLSLSIVEAAVGVLLVVGVAAGFAIGVSPPPAAEPQLDSLARDTGTVLATDPADTGRGPWVIALTHSDDSFARVRDSVRERTAQLLPGDVAFRIRTPHGTVGYPRPPTVAVGTTTIPTRHGPVTVRVWYG
ncbi:DUF7262 family protein [Haloplanus halobius]|uniref:DUF7262 family protein n=1 Tax=Haloplanus halobius TaxID=2934938 RepID=UPI00200F1DB0|nr:hypothetical protein [Haloplanus sp. XH21]